METHEITIVTLIERGNTILMAITEIPPKPNVVYLGSPFYKINKLLEYETWKNDVIRYFTHYYLGDISIESFKDAVIEFERRNNSPRAFYKMLGILESCKNIPKVIEQKVVAPKVGAQINIHNNNTQSQSQQQSQSVQIFLEAIKYELTGKQQKELEALVKEELPEAEKRTKIIDQITSFGSDVAANIIANIVTNPIIWG